jgi:hypothetical protein
MSNETKDPLNHAFQRYLEHVDATLTPPAFLRWLKKEQPNHASEFGDEAVLDFANRYLASALRSGAIRTLPPLVPHRYGHQKS